MDQSPKNKINYRFLPLIFAIILIFGIQIGFKMYESLKPASGQISLRNLFNQNQNTLNEVLNYIDNRYVDTIASEKLIGKVIEETIDELDPHSSYIPAADLQHVNEDLEGNFDGVGIEFSIVKDTVVVVAALSGGPSEALGILPGDKIVTIEDSVFVGKELTNKMVINQLRGPKGSKVKVGIVRTGNQEPIEFVIRRGEIPLYSVDVGYLITPKIGYIKVSRFSATTYNEFGKALYGLQQEGMESLIVDMRGNPGGYIDAAVNIVDEFIDKKRVIVSTKGINHSEKKYVSRKPGLFEKGDLVVLIDENSASASEIVAGAIQDWDRGLIIGRKSFGKGLVQEQYELTNGAAMRLTVARYYTPSGRCIQKPYKNGETEDYYSEIYDRYENGELFEQDKTDFPDSLKFSTPSGRIVYGGGGIAPDVFVPLDTTASEDYMYLRQFVPGFSYQYYSLHQEVFVDQYDSWEKFDSDYDAAKELFVPFGAFLNQEGILGWKELTSNEKYKVGILLKSFIARQLWYNDGYYPMIHKLDQMVIKAVDLLEQDSELLGMTKSQVETVQ